MKKPIRARKANTKTKANTASLRQSFVSANGGPQRLSSLIFANNPNVLDLRL